MKLSTREVHSLIDKVAASKYVDVFQAIDCVLFLGYRSNILTESEYKNIIFSLCKYFNDLEEGADSVAPEAEHR